MQDCPNPGRCTRIPCVCEEREGKPPRQMPAATRLREVVEMIAKAELYDPATGIIDADVLEAVQEAARSALAGN